MTVNERVDPLSRIKTKIKYLWGQICVFLEKLQDPEMKRIRQELKETYRTKFNEIYEIERKDFLEKKAVRDAKKAAKKSGLFSEPEA